MLPASLLAALLAGVAPLLPAPLPPLAEDAASGAAQSAGPLADARALLASGDAEAARAQLEAHLDAHPGDAAAVGLLVDAHLALGHPEQAVAVLDERSAGQPAHVEHALAAGRAYLAWADRLAADGAAQEDIDLTLLDALSSYERAVELAPDDPRAVTGLGYVHLYRYGDHTAALELAEQALEAAPEDGELLLLRGCAGVYEQWNLAQSGDAEAAQQAWNSAVSDLRAAAEKLPHERIEPWAQLAYLHEAAGDGVQAVRAANEIADRQPEPDFDNLYRLAKKYSFERNWDASSLALQKITSLSALELTRRLRAEPQRDQVATELAWSVGPLVNRGDRATALGILRAVVRAGVESPDVWHNYAVLCEETRDAEEAKLAYEKVIELAPERPRAYNDLGSLLHRVLQTDIERAKELYGRCIELATEQLADADLPEALRAELVTARDLAQDSLDELVPKTPERALGGLLDGLLEGLDDDEDDEGGDTTGG